jgi:hypothetical protein
VGRLDLLCIDENSQLVLIELKRGQSPREAVAQTLDYGSWLDTAREDVIQANAKEYLGQSLEDAFSDHFGTELTPISPQTHKILLVASGLDTSAERIVNYLSERYSVPINAVFFKYVKLKNGDEMLVRSVLVSEELAEARSSRKLKPTGAELDAMAANRHIVEIVEKFRQSW